MAKDPLQATANMAKTPTVKAMGPMVAAAAMAPPPTAIPTTHMVQTPMARPVTLTTTTLRGTVIITKTRTVWAHQTTGKATWVWLTTVSVTRESL